MLVVAAHNRSIWAPSNHLAHPRFAHPDPSVLGRSWKGLCGLLQQSGYSPGDVQTHLDTLDDRGIQCLRDLREQLQEGTGLDELGFPASSYRKKLSKLIAKERLVEHSWNDIEIAHSLSQVAYQTKHDQVLQSNKARVCNCRCAIATDAWSTATWGSVRRSCWNMQLRRPEDQFECRAQTRCRCRRPCPCRFLPASRASQVSRPEADCYCMGVSGSGVRRPFLRRSSGPSCTKVLSIGIGSPMCVAPGLVRDMRMEQWTSKFLTIANDEDPVPALLNVADTLQQLGRDAQSLGNGICASLFDMLVAVAAGDGIPHR